MALELVEVARCSGSVEGLLGVLLRIQAGSTDEWAVSDNSNTVVALRGDGAGGLDIIVQEVRESNG